MSGPAAPPFAAVYFDCDSTLASVEGVDELLAVLPPELRDELRELTKRAMEGDLPLAEVYEQRLARIAPTRAQLEQIGKVYCDHLVQDAAETVAALRFLGKHVGIVSGGLDVPVRVLADHLGIPQANVHAVPVRFDETGHYLDFDRSSPLWRNRGKVEIIAALPPEQRPVLYVGDGVTDLEVQGVADLFAGFGGVAVRDRVKAGAQVWLPGPSLAGVLAIALTPEEQRRLQADPVFRSVLSSGDQTGDARSRP